MMRAASQGLRLVAFAGFLLSVAGRYLVVRSAASHATKGPSAVMSNVLSRLVAPLIPKSLKPGPSSVVRRPDGAHPDGRDAVTEAFFKHRRENPDPAPGTPIARRMQSGRA